MRQLEPKGGQRRERHLLDLVPVAPHQLDETLVLRGAQRHDIPELRAQPAGREIERPQKSLVWVPPLDEQLNRAVLERRSPLGVIPLERERFGGAAHLDLPDSPLAALAQPPRDRRVRAPSEKLDVGTLLQHGVRHPPTSTSPSASWVS